jgi:cbb3-type cytochrome oxidase maturation protein
MVDFDVLGPYVVALMMSLGALWIFVWGVLAGAFNDADEAALRFFQVEMDHERTRQSHRVEQ